MASSGNTRPHGLLNTRTSQETPRVCNHMICDVEMSSCGGGLFRPYGSRAGTDWHKEENPGCQNHPITAVVDGDWSEIAVT